MLGTWQLYKTNYTKSLRRECLPSRRHGIPTTDRHLDRQEAHQPYCTSLDLLLQGMHGIGFHNCLRWFCLHLHLLSENVANASFCCWLHTGLDTAEAWKCEHTVLLNLRGCHGHQAVHHLGAC